VQLFCLVLSFERRRISEILALTPAATTSKWRRDITTLKRRKPGIARQVPLLAACSTNSITSSIYAAATRSDSAYPQDWRWSRTTHGVASRNHAARTSLAYRNAKGVGVTASASTHTVRVPLPLLKRWMGHASIRSTEIDLDVMGPDERAIAAWMWSKSIK